jgi:hypothetical protein
MMYNVSIETVDGTEKSADVPFTERKKSEKTNINMSYEHPQIIHNLRRRTPTSQTAGDPHHQRRTFEMNQNARKTAMIRVAMRQGLRLPVPIPNACPALREVCMSVVPNEENRSPWHPSPVNELVGSKMVIPRTYSFVENQILRFDIAVYVGRYL